MKNFEQENSILETDPRRLIRSFLPQQKEEAMEIWVGGWEGATMREDVQDQYILKPA